MSIIHAKRLLSVIEAAHYLSISRAKLYQYLQTGEIPSVNIASRRLIDVLALDRFADSLKTSLPKCRKEKNVQ